MGMEDFDHKAFMKTYTPRVGLAISGGGYRSMLTSGGALWSFDSRSDRAMRPAGLGGLLQGSMYISGLSGGSFLVGSLALNDFPTIEQIKSSERLWKLKHSIFSPIGKPLTYYADILAEIRAKKDVGFEVTITDIWSAMLSRVMIDQPNGGPGMTLSSVSNSSAFQNFEMPFPIFLAVARAQAQAGFDILRNSNVYEFNPLEFGSHDPLINAFFPTEMLGSDIDNGKFINGFDNGGLVMGTSSSVFNQVFVDLKNKKSDFTLVRDLYQEIVKYVTNRDIDVADWSPNPFYPAKAATSKKLNLVDAGMSLENIPFTPYLCPHRKIDLIVAIDSSADTLRADGATSSWPNGTALRATYDRYTQNNMEGITFPAIPDANTFINLGLNNRPTWFGCDAKNMTSQSPLVVYIPNAPYNVYSNISTFRFAYEDEERDMLIDNGFMVATQGNGVLDPEWASCVGCAVVHREMERRGTITEQCRRCLQRYCWDGTTDTTEVDPYQPELKLRLGMISGGQRSPHIQETEDYSRFRDYAN
ncbi:Lysophospholipase [Arthrobotrys entomopaga]|nr:Lysophospholipase [Arthrobotrys entomopaga]